MGKTVTCHCSSDLDAVSIGWYQGNSTTPLITNDGSIEIQAATENQGDTYTCSADNICGSEKDTITVQVIGESLGVREDINNISHT